MLPWGALWQRFASLSCRDATPCPPADPAAQREVLEESDNMIPDCEARLKSAYEDLVSFLVRGGELQVWTPTRP